MKFSTFIIIALLALIAYALLRPAPSPNATAVQEFLRLAQRAISALKSGGPDTRPTADQPLPSSESGGRGSLPMAHQPAAPSNSDDPSNGKSSRALPRFTWNPFANVEDGIDQKHYAGRVRQHLEGDCLLIRSGTKLDSGSGSEYMLTGFPGAAELPLDAQIEFSAYSAGDVTLKSDTETKTVSILVYSSAQNPKSSQRAQNGPSGQYPQPAQDTPPPRPGSWMWDQRGALDRGPYNRK